MEEYILDEYKELLSQLEEIISEGEAVPSDNLYVVRQSGNVDYKGMSICPVVDFFFSSPKLKDSMSPVKVVDAKKALFDILGEIEDEGTKEAISTLISYLKDYTSNNNKRNDKNCFVVSVEESAFPMMIYFEEDQVSDKLELITVDSLISELKTVIEK